VYRDGEVLRRDVRILDQVRRAPGVGPVTPVIAREWKVINFNAHEVGQLVTVLLDEWGDFKDTSTYKSLAPQSHTADVP
jgi:hypothetical protein